MITSPVSISLPFIIPVFWKLVLAKSTETRRAGTATPADRAPIRLFVIRSSYSAEQPFVFEEKFGGYLGRGVQHAMSNLSKAGHREEFDVNAFRTHRTISCRRRGMLSNCPSSRIRRSSVHTSGDLAWQEAVRRTEVLRPLAESQERSAATVTAVAARLGLNIPQTYRLLRKFRAEPQSSALLCQTRGHRRGNARVAAAVERLIEEAIEFARGTPVRGSVPRRGACPMVSLRACSEREALNAASFMAWLEPGQRSWGGCLMTALPGPYRN